MPDTSDEVNMQYDAGGGDRWNSVDNVAGQGAGVILNYGSNAYNNASTGSATNSYFDSGVGDTPYSNMDFSNFNGSGGLGDLSFSGGGFDPWSSLGGGGGMYEPGFWGDNSFDSGMSTMGDYQTYTPTSDDLSSLYGDAGYGERYSEDPKGNDFLKKYKESVSPLQGFLKNPIVSTLMGLHPATAVLKTLLGGPNSVGGFLGSLFSSNPLGKLAGSIGGSQLANYATEGQFAPMSSSNIGGIAGTALGMLSGNPYGASLGGLAGRQIGGMDFTQGSFMPGETGGMPNTPQMSMGIPTGGGMTGGMGGVDGGSSPNLLSTGMNNGWLGAGANLGMGLNNNRMIGNQINTLEGLFGQNSAYAQQMRQQLERRDAAAGRRSQYGPREVELQAALAGNAAKLQPGLQQLYSQKMGNTNLLVQSLLRNPGMISNAGSGLKDAAGWLSNLFSGGGSTTLNNPYWNNGGFQSGNEGMGD